MSFDFSTVKAITIPEGVVTKIVSAGTTLWQTVTSGYTNLVPLSTDTDGSIFNGVGYKTGYRLNSSATEKTATTHVITGFIPYTDASDTIYVSGLLTDGGNSDGSWQNGYIFLFDSSYNWVGRVACSTNGDVCASIITACERTVDAEGISTIKLTTSDTNFSYLRLSGYNNGTEIIVTVNEEIA